MINAEIRDERLKISYLSLKLKGLKMRSLVIETIMKNFKYGLTETGLVAINWDNEKLFPRYLYEYDEDIPFNKLEAILECLTDQELLNIFDSQCCQEYR